MLNLREQPVTTEAAIEVATFNVSENTNFRSLLKASTQCSCIMCPDGPARNQKRCKGPDGKCTNIPCKKGDGWPERRTPEESIEE